MKSILRRSFGKRHCDVRLPKAKRRLPSDGRRAAIDRDDLCRLQRVYRNLRGIAGHNVWVYSDLKLVCPEIRYFAMLRDPVSTYRSDFLNRSPGHRRADFDRRSANPMVRNWQTKLIAGEPKSEKAIEVLATQFDFVGLTERFDESVVMLGSW